MCAHDPFANFIVGPEQKGERCGCEPPIYPNYKRQNHHIARQNNIRLNFEAYFSKKLNELVKLSYANQAIITLVGRDVDQRPVLECSSEGQPRQFQRTGQS